MLFASIAVVIGFILLVWSADKFIDGAAATAHHAGMSALSIGMLIVGFGTSAPEIFVSIIAAIDGAPAMALGNALGSNIVNTGLVLGITAIIVPITVNSKIVRGELPLLLFICLVVGFLLYDGALTRIESSVLVCGFFLLIAWTAYSAWRTKTASSATDPLVVEVEQEFSDVSMPLRMSLKKALFWLVVGLICLIVSSRILVWGAVEIAVALAVDDLVIGLTIVALGTSLPELAASILAVRKGEHDIAIGNVVGSNLFNLLAVIGFAGVISPLPTLPADVLQRDWMAMMLLTSIFFVMAIGIARQGRINRLEGGILLGIYCGYMFLLFQSVSGG